ncbi:MAG: sulfatase-like hydrolase/transferase [Verrucomicrobiota bacterium]
MGGLRLPSSLLFGLATLCLLNADSPNFIVILSDDQSWVGSSLQIDPKDERTRSDYFRTPQLERLAREGMSFTRGYAPAPFCCPTRRSLLVGQTPARHIYSKDQRRWTGEYRRQLSLPQMLKKADSNYRTAHFGKWDMRFDEVTPEEMGYDESDGYTDNGTGGNKGSGGPAARTDPKLIFEITERTRAFMEASAVAGKPFFVQVSHYAVHLDIFYREETLDTVSDWKQGTKHHIPEFAAMTSDMDEGIGSVLNKVESLGLEDSTYIFFLSDNGGRNSMPGHKDVSLHRNDPLRDGKGSMYEGGIRVPFLVKGPGIARGSFSRTPVSGLDIFPTLAELSGYKMELPRVLDGGSLAPILIGTGEGEVRRSNPFMIFHQAVARDAETALLMGDYKLIKTWKKARLELFDLSEDVGEERDLSKKMPAKVDELHQLMVDFLEDAGAETRKTGSKSDAYERAARG